MPRKTETNRGRYAIIAVGIFQISILLVPPPSVFVVLLIPLDGENC
jgi:hypothetical protein